MDQDTILYNSIAHKKLLIEEITKIHGGFKNFSEADFYPEHEKRYETDQYKKIRNKIVEENNASCVVCGVNTKILKNPIDTHNPAVNFYQANQIELHHFHIEWALTNAIDQEKFNNLLRPHLKYLHPTEELYQKELTIDQIKDWIDHHPHNLIPLCNVHHRHKYWGIHHITYPSWGPANLLQQEFISQILKKLDQSNKFNE